MREIPGSILTRGNILFLNLFLFSHSKASDVNIGITATFVQFLSDEDVSCQDFPIASCSATDFLNTDDLPPGGRC